MFDIDLPSLHTGRTPWCNMVRTVNRQGGRTHCNCVATCFRAKVVSYNMTRPLAYNIKAIHDQDTCVHEGLHHGLIVNGISREASSSSVPAREAELPLSALN